MSEREIGGSSTTTYWFKRRRYGWGFTPVTWQGWTSVVAMVALVLVPAFWLRDTSGAGTVVAYVVYVLLVVAGFVALAVAKGPRPRWRWGSADGDDPGEDF